MARKASRIDSNAVALAGSLIQHGAPEALNCRYWHGAVGSISRREMIAKWGFWLKSSIGAHRIVEFERSLAADLGE